MRSVLQREVIMAKEV